MATPQTLCDPTGRWLVDRVYGETGVDYRVWDNGVLAAEIQGRDNLAAWLSAVDVDIKMLRPAQEGFEPFPIM
jgi:hypothetical protein